MMPRLSTATSFAVSLLLATHGRAQEPASPVAIDVACAARFATAVTVDGIQADWEAEAAPVERVAQLVEGAWQYDYTGPNDASFRLWCRSAAEGIYLAVVGRDNVIVERDDDEGDFFEIHWIPDGLDDDAMRVMRLDLSVVNGEGRTSFVDDDRVIADAVGEVAPRENGYFVEAFIPSHVLGGVPFAPIRFAAFHRDLDNDTSGERDALVGTAAGTEADELGWLRFEHADLRVETIAERAHIELDEVFARALGNVGGTPGRDLVAVMGDNLYLSGEGFDGFSWLTLGVRTSDDEQTTGLELHDLDGDGDVEIFHRQTLPHDALGAGLVRTDEIVHVYDFRDGELVEIFSQIVAITLPDGRRLTSAMSIDGRASDREVRFEAAVGDIDAASFPFVDDGGVSTAGPLPLPWLIEDGIVWTRSGSSWSLGSP